MTRASRVRFTSSERSEDIALRIAELFEASPFDEAETMGRAADHVLRIADDNHKRTRGKRRTWAQVSASTGRQIPDSQRLKNVAGLLGAMLTLEPRRTKDWVCDILEDALTYWPWEARKEKAA